MQALGDKISSTIIAQSAGVSCIKWSGDGITVQADANGLVHVRESDMSRACIKSASDLLKVAETLGFPLMIKASEGGGGKGIRLVKKTEDLEHLYEQVCKELPGSPVFLMGLCQDARHLEIQVVADEHGNCTALYGRDCSVQRRHQKIIEEAPIIAASDSALRAMERAAVDMARSVGYHNAGTVEFLYQPSTDQYFFLELNPRLQVEHPTTEMITGVNLPAVQLQVAMGIPLHQIPDIRMMYGQDPEGSDPIALDLSHRTPPKGHVLAARITAENPLAGFKPNGGTVEELRFTPGPGVWGYFSLCNGSSTHDFFDSQFGHIFARGESREEARINLLAALSDLVFRGTFQCTSEAIVDLLRREEFKTLAFTTQWLDGLIAAGTLAKAEPVSTMDVSICVAASWGYRAMERSKQSAIAMLEKYQTPQSQQILRSVPAEFTYRGLLVKAVCEWGGPRRLKVLLNGGVVPVDVVLDGPTGGGMQVEYNGRKRQIHCWSDSPTTDRFIIDGHTCIVKQDTDPSIIISSSSGKLVRYRVEEGDLVKKGQGIAEIEVMKMCMEVCAEDSGRISLCLQPGAILRSGSIIANLELLDSSPGDSIKQQLFDSKPVVHQMSSMMGENLYEKARSIEKGLVNGLCGVNLDPACHLREFLSICKRPDQYVADVLEHHIAYADKNEQLHLRELRKKSLSDMIRSLERVAPGDSQQSLLKELKLYQANGPTGSLLSMVGQLCSNFVSNAALFDSSGSVEDAVKVMRLRGESLESMLEALCLHYVAEKRSSLLVQILDEVIALDSDAVGSEPIQTALRALAELRSLSYSRASRKARELLFHWQLPPLEELRERMEVKFTQALQGPAWTAERERDFVEDMVRGFSTHLDVLPRFFHHGSHAISQLALEIYIRRMSESYQLCGMEHIGREGLDNGDRGLLWYFASPVSTDTITPEREVLMSPAVSVQSHQAGQAIDEPFDPKLMGALRCGIILALPDVESINKHMPRLLSLLRQAGTSRNVLYFVISNEGRSRTPDENSLVQRFEHMLSQSYAEALGEVRVRRVTLAVVRQPSLPSLGFYTFRHGLGFREDCTIRHMDPSMAYLLEFNRLTNFDVRFCHADPTGQIHIYHATPKPTGNGASPSSGARAVVHDRLYVRLVIRPNQAMRHFNSVDELLQEVFRILEETLEAVEAVISGLPPGTRLLCNHLFFNVLPIFVNTAGQAEELFRTIMGRYDAQVKRLNFRQGEIKMNLATARGVPPTRHRFILSNETGHCLRIDGYFEERDPTSGRSFLRPLNPGRRRSSHADLCEDARPRTDECSLQPASAPYPASLDDTQLRRYRVQSTLGTSYIHDFPLLFTQAISEINSAAVVSFEEGYLDSGEQKFVFGSRPAGLNTCGMVGWRLTVREGGQSTEVIIIGNDISFEIGSFGVGEDRLFYELSTYARTRGIPRVFLSANSGARIGLADEVFKTMRIAWLDEARPGKGLSYLYLTPEDHAGLPDGCVKVAPVEGTDPTRLRITDIIGAHDGIGVENLAGSALIAGETARAYDESFTLTLVTGRSVGIGAYLVRLGQRAIQKHDQPIILTGYAALNAVLGREVYQSNLQLGGPQVMDANGVSHLVVKDDWEGVQEVIRWLGYLPGTVGKILCPKGQRGADVDLKRPVDIAECWDGKLSGSERDPRLLLTGAGKRSGLLDRGSFKEYLAGWARSVIVGRGRLGGTPLGIITTEVRTSGRLTPADPANPDSRAVLTTQAGQVWFPDSAHKTAQALRDFARERLPVLILASWRGFSGGQRDLFEEILKFGSMIVEALATYPLPVFVYIPPGAELRGGAWVPYNLEA